MPIVHSAAQSFSVLISYGGRPRFFNIDLTLRVYY
jgi:hypothetical protein